MRTNLALAISAALLTLTACSGPSSAPTPEPQPGGVGVPTGPAAHASIGPEGGTLTSADGHLKLSVPAGALSAPTDVAVQAISVTAPHGRLAYRLTPAGLTLTQPAELTVSADASVDNPAAGAVLAEQDAQGHWQAHLGTRQDRATHSLKLATRTFRDFAWAEALNLTPAQATVKTGQGVGLQVQLCLPDWPEATGGLEDLLAPLTQTCAPARLNTFARHWAVNGAPGGSAMDGAVTPSAGEAAATYTAPAQVPPANPVAVSVDWVTNQGGQTAVTLVSAVTVEQEPVKACNGQDAPDRWEGQTTTDMRVNGVHQSMTSTVTFERDPLDAEDPDLCTYHVKSGTVVWNLHDTMGGCTYSAPTVTLPIAPTDGTLSIDTSTTPFTYVGSGGTGGMTTVTVDCPDGSTSYQTPVGVGGWLTIPQDRTWHVSADGQSFSGQAALGENSWKWTFTHAP